MEASACDRRDASRRSGDPGRSAARDPAPYQLPRLRIALSLDELRAHNYVCTECGHHFRLGADVWVPLIADQGSWLERWTDVRSHDLLNWTVPKRYQQTVETLLEEGLNEAVRTGTCTLAKKPI